MSSTLGQRLSALRKQRVVETAQIEMCVSGCREADAPATYAQRGMWCAARIADAIEKVATSLDDPD